MKKIFKILVLLFTFLSLTGCDYKEINDYAIVSGISIDINKKNNSKYDVGVQIMNAKKDEESSNSQITFYKASGKTIYEALRKIILDSPKELYLGHNEVVIISEHLLKKEDPLNYLDFFMRDSRFEKDSLVIVSKNNRADSVLKIITPLETIPSRNLKATLKNADIFNGSLSIITMDEFVSTLKNKNKEAILPSIIITGDYKDGEKMKNIEESNPNAKLKFSTLAYFKNNKLKGYLTNDESVGYNMIINEAEKTYINVKCDNKNYATLQVEKAKSSENIYQNKSLVKINTKVDSNLVEYNCKADFINNEKYIKDLEKKSAKKVKNLINKAIEKLYEQEKTDAIGYTDRFYKNKDFNINNIKFEIKTKVSIKSTNLSIKSVKE